jgi:N-acetylneuraminic acid mutarotase
MTRYLRTLHGVVFTVVLTFTAASLAYAQGSWTSLAPVQPLPTESMAVGGVGQVIIAAYGYSAGDTNLTRLYNISRNSWTLGSPAPLPPRSDAALGENTHGGFFYVAGGRSNLLANAVIPNLEQYDPETNTWTTLAPMLTARAGAAIAVFDDALYVFGGHTDPLPCCGPCGFANTTVVERYNIDTGTWSAVAPMPLPRSGLAARTHGGKIYVFGGCVGAVSLSNVDMYDPVTDTWTTGLAPMPTPRASFVAGRVGDQIYAIGGYSNNGPALNVNEVYDVSKNNWSTAAPMPTPRVAAGENSHGGRVYVVGGAQPGFGLSSNANEVFKTHP